MKKIVNAVKIVVMVLVALVVSSCLTTSSAPVGPYTYTGSNPIYPAVNWAISNGEPTIWKKADVTISNGGNKVVIKHVQGNDGLKVVDFTFTVELKDSKVQYEFSDIHARNITDDSGKPGEPVSGFTLYDKNVLINYFNTEIPKVMEDPELYAKVKGATDETINREK